ncbi:MAG: ATP-binding protein [Usitatibacter sp.]
MPTLDMRDYPPAARATWFILAIIGYVVLTLALVDVVALPRDTQVQVWIAAAVAAIVGFFPVRIPGTRMAFAGGEIFIFLALLLYGPSAAIVGAAFEGFVASSRTSKKWTSRLLTPSIASFSMLVGASWFNAARSALGTGGSFTQTLALVFVFALCYFAVSVTLVRLFLALKARAPIAPLTWLVDYRWGALAYLASASVAAVLYASRLQFGLEAILIVTPLLTTSFLAALHFYFERKQDDERHVGELMASEHRLQQALQVAEHASRAKTHFLAAASHDLRQPLHALTFLTAALDMRPLDGVSREIVSKMENALEDLSLEFDSLLDISKLDAGVVPCTPTTFELRPFLHRIGEPFNAVARARGLSFDVEGPNGAYVHTDRALLERVVRNILDNAFKYTERGGVRMACEAGDGLCRVVIADSGIGIPETEQQRVFEEFYQVGNAERDRRKGMGLGLSIVTRLASLLELRVGMASAVGHGTTFTLELPAVERPAQVQPRPLLATTKLHDRQVLVIDDEPAPRDALRGFLEGLGCRVSVAGTIEEAAALALLEEPDIVLADFRLRGETTGLQAVQRLRQGRPALPAIIITGDTAPEQVAKLDGIGICVLYKPVAPERLLEAMGALLEEDRPTASMDEAAVS